MSQPNNLRDILDNLSLSIENNRVALLKLNKRLDNLLTALESAIKNNRRFFHDTEYRLSALERDPTDM